MRGASILLAGLLTVAAPASAITPMSPLRCTIVHALNRSTGEPTDMEGRSVVISPADLRVDGRHYTSRQTTHDAHGYETINYRIARAGLTFEATALRKRDDIGEEHVIRLTGTCVHKVP